MCTQQLHDVFSGPSPSAAASPALSKTKNGKTPNSSSNQFEQPPGEPDDSLTQQLEHLFERTEPDPLPPAPIPKRLPKIEPTDYEEEFQDWDEYRVDGFGDDNPGIDHTVKNPSLST
jgi:hypothetical protein